MWGNFARRAQLYINKLMMRPTQNDSFSSGESFHSEWWGDRLDITTKKKRESQQ